MKILGLIPARGGSKRLPGKNLVDLGGRPLISWTISEAKRAKTLAYVAVSTDDITIRRAVVTEKCSVIHRPDSLSQDDTPSLSVVTHAVSYLSQAGMPKFDAVALLQPTSPFRSASLIDEAVTTFQSYDADSLVGVGLDFVVNGSIYITRTDSLRRGCDLYDDRSIRFVTSDLASIDIDTQEDLDKARAIVAAAVTQEQ